METPESGVQAAPAAAQAAAVPSGSQPAATPAAATQPQGQPEQTEVKVPLHVVTALRDELSTTKQGKSALEQRLQQLEMMQRFQQSQPQTQPQQPEQPQAPADPFAGLSDDEVLTAAEMKKIVQAIQSQQKQPDFSKVVQPLASQISKMELQIQDPHYEQTIRTYLPEMVTQNPSLQNLIVNSPNQLQAALAIAKMSPKYLQAQQQPAQPQVQPDILSDLSKIIENATKPAAPGAMGGSGAISGNDRFRNMSDADFDAEVQRVMGSRVA